MKMFQDEEHIVMSPMSYFKDSAGNVFAYDDEQVTDGLAEGKTLMTPEEVKTHKNPPLTAEQIQAQINAEALAYLASTDWYVIRSKETGAAIPDEILAAREAARSRIVR